MQVDEWELNARRRKYEQIKAALQADSAAVKEIESTNTERAQMIPGAIQLLQRLRETGDFESVRREIDLWSRPKATGFGDFGAMFLNQLAILAPDKNVVAALMTSALSVPHDRNSASEKIGSVLEFTQSIKRGGQPAPKRIPFVLSYFWSMQDPLQWPCLWKSAEASLASHLGWLVGIPDFAAYYLDFRDVVLSLGDSLQNVGWTLYWFDQHRFVGLDPTLVARCNRAFELRSTPSREYPAEQDRMAAERNARAMIAEMHVFGADLETDVAQTLGRTVKLQKPSLEWKPGTYRGDSWVDWRLADAPTNASIRAWATVDGIAIGIYPGWTREGWYDEAAQALREFVSGEVQFLNVKARQDGITPIGNVPAGGEFLLGRWFPGEAALGRRDLRRDVLNLTEALKPAIEKMIRVAAGTPIVDPRPPDEKLAASVQRFINERHYPNDKDESRKAERKSLAALLTPDQLPVADIVALRQIWNSDRYAHPGPQSMLNSTIAAASPADLEKFLQNLAYLLWGDEKVETRINRLLDPNDRGARGLGESVVIKLLAIAHPDRFLPIFPYTGDMGKAKLMKLIGLTPPDASLSRGERHVLANDSIRRSLDAFFPGDPWGQGQLLYWLGGQAERPPETDVLGTLAEELYVEKSALVEIVELLREKKQIILYGPPGTGKTYLAWKLAGALAPDPSRRMLVQFHPSTSYEDFFEGYRPEGDANGQLTYRLVPGPLALMASRAQNAPGIKHVMVIDEINRANLPKVFGELLFLLEYREERIPTLYRAEEAFELPPDLLFIGTMNTADRSIALIDAAMRRRFFFIPFFPDSGLIAELLDRWLEAHGEPLWVGELVRMVNRELIEDLGGPHLQIGPSHFMQKGLTEERLARIWKYSVFPFIEDQLFGNADRIGTYTYDRVRARFKQLAGGATLQENDDAVPSPEQ